MKKIMTICTALLVAAGLCAKEPMTDLTKRVFDLAKTQFTAMDARLAADRMPVSFEDGKVKDGKIESWTSGFFPGSLWYVYEYTQDPGILELAWKETRKLSDIVSRKTHHDIGFQVNSSFGNAYRLTGDQACLDVMKQAASKLSTRFNPTVGCTKSWDGKEPRWLFPVIVDNMMNLELLMATYRLAGGEMFKQIACTHANTTMKNHFRQDYSTYHVVSYDPETGKVQCKETAQGFSDESCWSRGESWALYGYTMMYRETKDPAYLDQARNIAEYTIRMLPKDGIPEWDFNAPGTRHAFDMSAKGAPSPKKYKYSKGDKVYRDSSAGAIIASALIELSTFTSGKESRKFKQTAETILRTLASPEYLSSPGENGDFLLKHGVTNLHGWSGVDIPLTYADYYFLEALLRYQAL